MNILGIKERFEAKLDEAVSDLLDNIEQAQQQKQMKTFYEFDCWVGTAWAIGETENPVEVLEGCLLVAAPTAEEAYDELIEMIRAMGQELEEYDVVVRKVK